MDASSKDEKSEQAVEIPPWQAESHEQLLARGKRLFADKKYDEAVDVLACACEKRLLCFVLLAYFVVLAKKPLALTARICEAPSITLSTATLCWKRLFNIRQCWVCASVSLVF